MRSTSTSLSACIGTDPVHCLVLTPFEVSASPALLAQIEEMGLEVEILDEPLEAMSRAALLDRLEAARAGWGLQAAGRIVLVIDTPGAIEDVQPLADAIARHLPNVRLVRFDPVSQSFDQEAPSATSAPGHPFRKAEGERAPADSPEHEPAPRINAPQLRLVEPAAGQTPECERPPTEAPTDEDAAESAPTDRPAEVDCAETGEQEESLRRLITQEELSMLLDDGDDADFKPPGMQP